MPNYITSSRITTTMVCTKVFCFGATDEKQMQPLNSTTWKYGLYLEHARSTPLTHSVLISARVHLFRTTRRISRYCSTTNPTYSDSASEYCSHRSCLQTDCCPPHFGIRPTLHFLCTPLHQQPQPQGSLAVNRMHPMHTVAEASTAEWRVA